MSEVSKSHFLSLKSLLNIEISGYFFMANFNFLIKELTEVWHMAHFWVSYGRCTMPGSPMGRLEG